MGAGVTTIYENADFQAGDAAWPTSGFGGSGD